MRRRELLKVSTSLLLLRPIAARAQQGQTPRRLGILIPFAEGDAEAKARLAALLETLEGIGWSTKTNLRVDYRWTAADLDRMRDAAKDLVSMQPDVLIGITTPGTLALARETTAVPIVFLQVSDPVGSGLVPTLAKPGGNVTGFTNFEYSMGGKWLQTLKSIAPTTERVGVLFNSTTAPYGKFYLESIAAAAPSIGVTVASLEIQDSANLDERLAEFSAARKGALVVLSDIFNTVNRDAIVAAATKFRVPAIYPFRFFVEIGGLVSYGIENIDLYRRAATYVDLILKGAKVAELPVQQPTKFELVINLKTAKYLGLAVPQTLLATADAVIE